MEIPAEYADRVQIRDDGCWVWTGWATRPRNGTGSLSPYGAFQRDKKQWMAHRYFFQLATGIDPGKQSVHHRCHNTLCVNPDHLELLPRAAHTKLHAPEHPFNAANLARETCKHGHPWTEETTYRYKGTRQCRRCTAEAMCRLRRRRGLEARPKTSCPKGHPYEGGNLFINAAGHRVCRACRRESYHRYKQRLQTTE